MLECPGTVIGPYKLLQLIGEGGMGMVWMAEQTQPVQRKVALKIIKPGLDSKQVLARFEAERQALALVWESGTGRLAGISGGADVVAVLDGLTGAFHYDFSGDWILP
jgi:serine/threonine protein kinase